MDTLDMSAKVLVWTGGQRISTNLGELLKAAGKKLPPGTTAPQQKPRVSTVRPASTDELARALGGLTSDTTSQSVIVPAKAKTHEHETIHITKGTLPGDTSGVEYLVVRRIEQTPSGEIVPGSFNHGFDKSWCYYHADRPADRKPIGAEWPLKKMECEVAGVRGTFWTRYVPQDQVGSLLAGLRACFQGAKMVIGDATHQL